MERPSPDQMQQPGPEQMSMNDFQRIVGYEQVGAFGSEAPMPPPPPPPPPSGDPPLMEFDKVANLSEEECQEAMLEFVAENCCYGKKPAQQHKIDKIEPSSALHYTLETFCEGRATGYVQEPFKGQLIDGPENGMAPLPWDIPCEPDQMFSSHKKKLEVPHTATVKECLHCHGVGWILCQPCHGKGKNTCSNCKGSGQCMQSSEEEGQKQVVCHTCNGTGKESCTKCDGDGSVKCKVCKGHRQLKFYIEMTVKYENHKEHHIIEKSDLPDELIKDVQGTDIFTQTLPQVWPIIDFPIKEINDASVRLTQRHRTAFSSERQLHQRQTLRVVPVTEVHYTWKEYDTRYWVYGRERKVYSPDYPKKCCWGCTII